jgi:hypothetical protein
VPLGDDLDAAVSHLDGGLSVDGVRRTLSLKSVRKTSDVPAAMSNGKG